MELSDLFKDRSNEEISAFAFNTGRMFEELINVRTNNIEEENKNLKAKILQFRDELKHGFPATEGFLPKYDEHFGIEKV